MNSKKDSLFEIINSPENLLKRMKIGELVRATLPIILVENLISEIEINNLLEDKYSKFTFDMNYPVLRKVNPKITILENRKINDYTRYYAGIYGNGVTQYLISSEWYERNIVDYIKWLKRKVKEN